MSYFTDADGNKYETINKDNLRAFQQWILTNDDLRIDWYSLREGGGRNWEHLKLDESISLKQLLTYENGQMLLDVRKKQVIAEIMSESERCLEMIDQAKEYPDILSEAWFMAGNSSGRNEAYITIQNELEKGNNIPALCAVMPRGFYSEVKFADGLKTISKQDLQMLEKIFISHAMTNKNQQDNVSRFFEDNIHNMYNLPTKNKEFRQAIEEGIIKTGRSYRFKLEGIPENIEMENISPRLACYFAPEISKDNKKVYNKFKQALIKIADTEPMYDRNNHGAEIPFIARFKTAATKAFSRGDASGDSKWMQIDIVRDAYLDIIQKAILDGKSDTLDKDDIDFVLRNDKNKYYLRKIPYAVLKDKNINLDHVSRTIKQVTDSEETSDRYDDSIIQKELSLKEQEAFAKRLKAKKDAEDVRKTALQSDVKEFNEGQKVLEQFSDKYQIAIDIHDTIEKIQSYFSSIDSYINMADNKDKKVEGFINKEYIEDIIRRRAKGEYVTIPYPEYKKPLFFKNKDQEYHRKKMKDKIDNFNEILKSQKFAKLQLDDYLGSMLDLATLEQAGKNMEQANLEYAKNSRAFWNKYKDAYYVRDKEYEISNIDNKNRNISSEIERIKARKESVKKQARENLGLDESKNSLQNPNIASTPENKSKIRESNKKVVDKLATKEKGNILKKQQEKRQSRR